MQNMEAVLPKCWQPSSKSAAAAAQKQISRAKRCFWRNSKTGWGSHDSIPCALFNIKNNNATIQNDIVVAIYRGGVFFTDLKLQTHQCKPMVCKPMEHVTAAYLKEIWDKNYWLFEGQHGLRLRESCDSLVITVCQNNADSLDNGNSIEAILNRFFKG
jgi:hypothetical protein